MMSSVTILYCADERRWASRLGWLKVTAPIILLPFIARFDLTAQSLWYPYTTELLCKALHVIYAASQLDNCGNVQLLRLSAVEA